MSMQTGSIDHYLKSNIVFNSYLVCIVPFQWDRALACQWGKR